MGRIKYRIPLQYKYYFCDCGKKLKYSSPKQMQFVLAMHRTSNKHRGFTSWPFNDGVDTLRNYELPSLELLNNEEFEKQLGEVLS